MAERTGTPGGKDGAPRPRRRRGEGSIFQRRSGPRAGEWIVKRTIGGRTVTVTAGSRTEAERMLGRLRQVDDERALEAERLTLAAFGEQWLARLRARPGRSQSTPNTYAVFLKRHIYPSLGALPLARLTPVRVERWLAELERRGLSAAGRVYAHTVLRALLNHAVRLELISRNPALRVDPPPVPARAQPPALTPAGARAILAAAHESEYEAVVVLSLTTGLRRGELCALRWEHVDLDRRLVRVVAQVRRDRSVGLPKSRKGRVVGLSPYAVEVLRRQQERQQRHAAAYPARYRVSGHVLTQRVTGAPYSPEGLRGPVKAILARAGFDAMRLHDLRHAFAALMFQAGAPDLVRQRALGHAAAGQTDWYTALPPELLRDAADRLDRLLLEDAPDRDQGDENPPRSFPLR